MSYIYKYTIHNLKYLDQLHTYIENIQGLPTNFNLYSEEEISIIFSEELSRDQINILTTNINNYSPPQHYKIIDSNEPLNIIQNTINSSVYTIIATCVWLSSTKNDDINLENVIIVSNLVGPQDQIVVPNVYYMIRLYDAINNKVMFESNKLLNYDLRFIKFKNIQNIPLKDSLIQLQVKVSEINYLVNVSAAHFTYYQTI